MLRLALVVLCVALALATPPISRTREDIEEFKSYIEKTQQDDGQTLEERIAKAPLANIWENSGKFQGDIVLDEAEMQDMVEDYATGRNAYIWPGTKWPNNVVIYQYADGHHNANQRAQIQQSMVTITSQSHGCVQFRERQQSDPNYVLVTGQNNGCYANVGFWSGRGAHTYNLAPGCFTQPIIIHEWLHILGFFHMQSTYNRYDYVNILWNNIQNGMGHNFDRYGNDLVSNLGLEYEYTSTMHYSSHAFSHNGQPTIQATRPVNGVMGQQSFISDRDWLRLRRHYNCPGAWNEELNENDTE